MGKKRSIAEILKHRGRSYLLTDLPGGSLTQLTEIENSIIDSRLTGLSFSQLSESAVRTAVDQIILKTAAITGCPFPQTEFFAEVLTTTLTEYLTEFGFGELTLEEIILAVKLNAKGGLRFPSGMEVEKVNFSGACFNIDFLSKILSNYMALRNNLDRKLENYIDGY